MTRHEAFTIAAISLVACTAALGCGDPCLPTIYADTLILPAEDACFVTTDAASTSSSTSDSSTVATTADQVTPIDMPPVNPLPVCIAIPAEGEAWGACPGGVCAEGLTCKQTPQGSVCLSPCDPNAPDVCTAGVCIGGACEVNACTPSCKAVGDPCPLPGMQCDYNSGDPLCVHVG